MKPEAISGKTQSMITTESRNTALRLKQNILGACSLDTIDVVIAEINRGRNNPTFIAEDVLCSIFNRYDIEIRKQSQTPHSTMEVFLTSDIKSVHLDSSLTSCQRVAAMLRLVAYFHYQDIRVAGCPFMEPAAPKPLFLSGLKKQRADNWVKRWIQTDIERPKLHGNSFAEGLLQSTLTTKKIAS